MKVPAVWHDDAEHKRKFAEAINAIDDGKLSSNAEITLTASATSTVITDRRVGKDSVILFMPVTANAAAALGAGTMYVTTANIDPRASTFTITHPSNSQTDKTFRYVVLGQTLN
tara:strand:+ start:2240 stop:2581 length:342 start_codon:yes stop_codon:yes gene_type:complete